MLSSSWALPGPMRAPDSKTMLILNRAMAGTVPRPSVQNRDHFAGHFTDRERHIP
jgi:hypothetical protein